MPRKRLFVSVIISITVFLSGSQLVFALDQQARQLFFTYEFGYFTYQGSQIVSIPKKWLDRDSGDCRVVLYNSKNVPVYLRRINDPRVEYYEETLPDQSITGGQLIRQICTFSIYINPDVDVSYAEFMSIGDLSLDVYQRKFHKIPNLMLGGCQVEPGKAVRIQGKIGNARLLNYNQIVTNGPSGSRIDIVFIPVDYGAGAMVDFNNVVDNLLFDRCERAYEDYRTLFDASPMKEAYPLINIHMVDIANLPKDWREQAEALGEDPKTWMDNFLKPYLPKTPEIYISVAPDHPFSTLSSTWHILIRADSCGSTLLRAFARSGLGGGLEAEFASQDNCLQGGPTEPYSNKNVTTETARDNIPWKRWIEASTPLPTPDNENYDDVVGLFEGALDYKCYYYRPERYCIMRGDFWDFCAVCKELFALNLVQNWLILYQNVTSNLPENLEDIIIPGDTPSLDFSVQFYQGVYEKLNSPDIKWYIDGIHKPAYNQLSTIKIDTLTLAPGKHKIKVGVSGYIKGTGGFIRSSDDNSSYYEFPEFEIAKGTYKRKK